MSTVPKAVREALGSVFQNIYAEGYPDPAMHGLTEAQILDYEVQLAVYRRNSDARYYKGVEYVDVLEALARRRAAEAFAANGVGPEAIYANVQPLSGSPANSAVYSALVAPGDTIMGMSLLHGGHLTHGSPANRSGKLYTVVSYGIDARTERLNYDEIEALAKQHRPKIIIAGYTSYPWMPDWARFRQIAEAVGAYLLADISHIAGMVAAGVVPSPIGHAHVISFTTHKTLYGPRGACILTTDKKLAAKIDIVHVPYKSGPQVLTDVAGGQVDLAVLPVALVQGMVKEGKVKAYGVTSKKPSEALPGVPSLSETPALASLDVESWMGLLGPAGLDPAIVARLHVHRAPHRDGRDADSRVGGAAAGTRVGAPPEGGRAPARAPRPRARRQ